MKLFQIEEPDGSPTDMPGAAVGIDAGGPLAEVAFAVGGNAVILADREGFERDIPVPPLDAPAEEWQSLFEAARLRAERALARPVTHVVLAFEAPDDAGMAALRQAADAAGLELLAVVPRRTRADAGEAPALAAAIMAEDIAPRPEAP